MALPSDPSLRTQYEVDGPFEIREISENNIGVFATEDLRAHDVIFREVPFYSSAKEKLIHYMTCPNPTGHFETDQEVRRLGGLIQDAMQRHMGKAGFNDEYPPEVRAVIDKLIDLINAEACRNDVSEAVRRKWFALHDAHCQVPKTAGKEGPERPYYVGAFGLTSEKGKTVNGDVGIVKGYDASKDRFCVKFDSLGDGDCLLLLKSSNLKTANGCLRTNAFDEGLFELRCRMNHACRGANNTFACTVSEYNDLMAGKKVRERKTGKRILFRPMIPRHEKECVILATKDIKKGQELTVNYVQGEEPKTTAMRQEQLWEKYRTIRVIVRKLDHPRGRGLFNGDYVLVGEFPEDITVATLRGHIATYAGREAQDVYLVDKGGDRHVVVGPTMDGRVTEWFYGYRYDDVVGRGNRRGSDGDDDLRRREPPVYMIQLPPGELGTHDEMRRARGQRLRGRW
eukprot:g6469.t1